MGALVALAFGGSILLSRTRYADDAPDDGREARTEPCATCLAAACAHIKRTVVAICCCCCDKSDDERNGEAGKRPRADTAPAPKGYGYGYAAPPAGWGHRPESFEHGGYAADGRGVYAYADGRGGYADGGGGGGYGHPCADYAPPVGHGGYAGYAAGCHGGYAGGYGGYANGAPSDPSESEPPSPHYLAPTPASPQREAQTRAALGAQPAAPGVVARMRSSFGGKAGGKAGRRFSLPGLGKRRDAPRGGGGGSELL